MSTRVEGIEKIEALAKRLSRLNTKMKPMFSEVGNIIVNATDEAFEQEGPGWKRLSVTTHLLSYTNMNSNRKRVSTKKGRLTRGFERYLDNRKILQKSGRLRGSITVRATNSEVRVGTNLPYAAIHQFGGMAGRGRKVKIPARPYFPIVGNTLRGDVVAHIEEYLVNQIKKEIL
jgi:phage virion morphogenesis protein